MKRKKRANTKKRVAKTPIIVKASLIIIVLFVFFATTFKIVEIVIAHKSDNFPRLDISLKDIAVEKLDSGTKDIKYSGNTVTATIDNKNTSYSDVEIKGRGNTTWQQIKKPYQLKFKEKESFFGIGESKKWVLLANYLDPTFLRNDIAFYLEKLLSEPYKMEGSFIELSIDDNYRGLYYLSEKVEIGKPRVNLSSDSGILVELDNIYGVLDGCYYSNDNDCIIVKDLTNEDAETTIMQDFIDNFNLVRAAAKKKDYKKLTSLIDIDSFVRYYLLSEFTINPDAYNTSFFMYKDGKDDKIHAGPGWDFDLAIGNKAWVAKGVDQDLFFSPFETMVLKNYLDKTDEAPHLNSLSTIIYDLMDIPEFQQRVKEIYQETLAGKGDEILDYIRSQAEYIKPAVLRDQERWKLKNNFDEEVDYLIDWVAKRYDHFEQTYGAGSPPINSN